MCFDRMEFTRILRLHGLRPKNERRISMKKHPLLRTALLVMTAAALLCVSALAVEDGAPANSMYGTFWALVPPVIAITLALITKEAYSSLFIGVTVGALFSQGFSPIGALNMIVNDGLVAAVSSTAEGLDTGISGIQLFIKAIPYNLYSLLTFIFIIALSFMQFDYGPMRAYERKARETGDLSALENAEDEAVNPKGKVIDLLLPVLVLIAVCTTGMIYVGGFFGVDAWGGTDCAGDFIGAFGNTDAFMGLPWGGIIALLFTVIYLVARRVITFKDAMACIPKGFNAMISPILILTLAVSLKATITSLGASIYVHDLMEGAAATLYSMLPAVIFVVACILAFASGTSWGTFGILIPIVTAIFPASSELLIIGISACCAGAVMGDHCSPISDTSIMASAGAQCDHLEHVATQIPYVLTVAGVCVVGFIVAGFVQNVYITWAVSFALMLCVLFVIRSMERRKAA